MEQFSAEGEKGSAKQVNADVKQARGIAKKWIIAIAISIVVLILLIVLLVVYVGKNDDDDDKKSKTPNPVSDYKVVQTKLGKIQGKVHQVVKDDNTSATVYEYRNIPYALPPLGDLRWRPPVAINQSWTDVLEYKKEEVWCKQGFRNRIVGTENCLILTIRQPSTANQSNPLPVLFWIHGGGLFYGSSYWYYPGEECSASLGMVTVSINYRLNMFGFLSIKEMWSPTTDGAKQYGNFGIMDMIEALKWVQSNIEHFGGDPKKVTIIGHSGGGAGVNSLITSPAAKGLFYKAISASGLPVPPVDNEWADARYGDMFKNDTNCARASSNDVMKCLRNVPSDAIILKMPVVKHPLDPRFSPWVMPYNEPINLYPTRVRDDVIIKTSIGEISKIHTPGLHILVGNTAAESEPLKEASTWEGFYKLLKPKIDSFSKDLLNTTLLPLYANRRPEDKTMPDNITSQYVHLVLTSDVILNCQSNDIVKNLSMVPGVKVYQYVASQPFSFKSSTDSFPPYAYHGVDTTALFGFDYKPYIAGTPPTKADLKLVQNIRKMVKDFVYNEKSFDASYRGKTIEFWDSDIVTWDKPYHEKECEVLRDNGFLKRSWGQIGV